jgi:Fe-S cluster assembly protein SufD
MTESPAIVIKKKTLTSAGIKEFSFSPDFVSIPQSVRAYYESAWKRYQQTPFPTLKDEPWRRTDIRALQTDLFATNTQAASPVPENLLEPLTDESHGGQIVLTPGHSQIFLSPQLASQGVVFTDLQTAYAQHPELVDRILGKLIDLEDDKFGALAAAMAKDGVLLYVPRHVKVETPLHSLFWGAGEHTAFFSHYLVYLDEGAEVTYVHESSSPAGQSQAMHSGLMELYVGEGAKLNFVELQSWGDNMWNFTHERIDVAREGTVDWIFGALGSHLTKNFSDLNLVGEGATGKMSGFYFTEGKQHLDHDTQQNHLAPHTTSDLLFKGALVGESESVWQGMIYVAPNATKTDGYQANRNLILDPRSKADSIPGLEILTDDVRCTHGATVGKIDQDQVFYLESRGLAKEDAERLIVEGFFDPIMQRIPFDGVKARFQRAIIEKLESFHLEKA